MEHKLFLSLGRVTRSSEQEEWEYVNSLDVAIWSEAVELFRNKEYFHFNCQANISVDWKPVLQHFIKHADTDVEFHKVLSEGGDLNTWFEQQSFGDLPDLNCSVSLLGANEFIDLSWYPKFFAERYVYDMFSVMNFAVPGSCDFLNITIRSDQSEDSDRLELSSFNFEEGLTQTLEGKNPALSILPINDVFKWFNVLDLGLKQKAESSLERALFSLFHICRLDGEITSIIWIFHALEAIYSTKIGEGFTNLHTRISSLLKFDKGDQAILKKNLRKLYDLRSAIVHGGYQVHHPMSSEVFDSRLDEDTTTYYQLNQYGFSLIVSSLQELIKNNWYGLEIEETIKGQGRPNGVSAGITPALPTPPSMRVRTRRLKQGNENVPTVL